MTTGTTRSSEGLDVRRRKLLFRCWHRGIREMDLILGRFADAAIADLSERELDELEHLLDVPDQELYGWVNGERVPPEEARSGLLTRLCDFHRAGPGPAA